MAGRQHQRALVSGSRFFQLSFFCQDEPDPGLNLYPSPIRPGRVVRLLLEKCLRPAKLGECLVRAAAEEQFGLRGLNDPDRIAARIADPPNAREVSVFSRIEDDPQLTMAFAEGAAENYAIRDAVIGRLATDDGQDEAALDQIFFAWRNEAVDAAEIDVRSQVGSWGGLAVGVLPPP